MPDIYGVTPDAIARELPGLFPNGFSQSSKPTRDAVVSLISTSDALISIAVKNATGAPASSTDDTALLAKRYITDAVLGQVARIVYAGQAPQDVATYTAMYDKSAATMLAEIKSLELDESAAPGTTLGVAGGPSTSQRLCAGWY